MPEIVGFIMPSFMGGGLIFSTGEPPTYLLSGVVLWCWSDGVVTWKKERDGAGHS